MLHLQVELTSEAGVEPSLAFLARLDFGQGTEQMVANLVNEHLFPGLNPQASDSAVRRLAKRLYPATIKQLVMLGEADHRGRALPWDGYPEGAELLAKAEQLTIAEQVPKRILMGRHLIELGLKPGLQFKEILDEVFAAQLDGEIQDLAAAKALAQTIIGRR